MKLSSPLKIAGMISVNFSYRNPPMHLKYLTSVYYIVIRILLISSVKLWEDFRESDANEHSCWVDELEGMSMHAFMTASVIDLNYTPNEVISRIIFN